MKITRYEGGIPYTEEVPDPNPATLAAFLKFLDSIPCSCRGEAHDECKPCSDCGEAPALNTYDGADENWCDDCWEAMVIEEERQFQLDRAEAEEFDNAFDSMREDHEAMRADEMLQREKEER